MKSLILIVTAIALISCINTTNKTTDATSPSSISYSDDGQNNREGESKIVGVISECYILNGVKGGKIINKRATETFKETMYCKIDPSCRVIILQTDGDWAQIRVIDPEWLSSSHIGWVEKKNLDIKLDKNKDTKSTNSNTYEILSKDNKSGVVVCRVLYKSTKKSEAEIKSFINEFRRIELANAKCLINIFDITKASELSQQYPIPDENYLYVADHYICSYDSNSNYFALYPLRDFKYKELGGIN